MIEREEWSLVAFTLLSQAALGLVLVAAVGPVLPGAGAPLGAGALGAGAGLLTWAAAALAMALLLSLLHLGTPAGAPRALRNLRTSWLSREILFTGGFAGLTAAAAILAWLGRLLPVLLWADVSVGGLAVGAMAAIYLRTVKPAWSTLFTPLSFFTAVLMLGLAAGAVSGVSPAVAAGGAAGTSGGPNGTPGWLPVSAGAVLAVQAAGLVLYLQRLNRGPGAARAARERLLGRLGWVLALRYLLGLVGVLLLSLAANLPGLSSGVHAGLAVIAAAALVAAEVLGRILFYASGVAIGVGRPQV